MSELTPELLSELIADDEHGLLTPVTKPEPVTNADILANRFEEVNEFIDEHERNPDPNNRDDIGEFQLGHRLQAILDNPEYRSSLEHLDRYSLFDAAPASMEDLLASDDDLLLDDEAAAIFDLQHVPAATKESPDKVAKGTKCEDFHLFEPLFIACHEELSEGRRELKEFRNPSNIREGAFYVQRGVLVYVAEVGELTQKKKGADGRLRCIYENGTESDLLLHSLARSLYEEGKIVTELIDAEIEILSSSNTGYVYVARTHSQNPELAQFEHLHKIGYTKNDPKKRISVAATDPTFLNAPASLVMHFELPIDYAKLAETVLHHFFSEVRLDLQYDDGTSPREWVNAPLDAIEKAVDLFQTGQIANYEYAPLSGSITLRSR